MKEKSKKPIVKKWWFWLIIIIAIIGVATTSKGKQASETTKSTDTPASNQSQTAPAPKKEDKPRLTLDDGWQIDKSNPYMTKVTGYVSNNSDSDIKGYIQITFSALDANNANVGDCLANANTVDAKGKWKFEAMCSGKDINTVRFKELTGF